MGKLAQTTVTYRPITTPPTPSTVRVFAVDGSGHIDCHPIDAKESVQGGFYSYEPPEVQSDNVETNSPSNSESKGADESLSDQVVNADLESMTKAQLQEYAEKAGVQISASMTKAELIEVIKSGGK